MSLDDNETKTNVIRCLASNDIKCDEKFLTEINHKNITSIFGHLTRHHGAYIMIQFREISIIGIMIKKYAVDKY